MSEQLDALPTTVRPARRASAASARRPEPISPEATLLREISGKLDRVIAVLAAQGKEKNKQVEILSAARCDSNLIGVVVGITGGAVRTLQSRQRKKASRGSAEQASPEAM